MPQVQGQAAAGVAPRVPDRSRTSARGRFRLKVFLGTDPVTRTPHQVGRRVSAKNLTHARRLLDEMRARMEAEDPALSGRTASPTVRALRTDWLQHGGTPRPLPQDTLRGPPVGRDGDLPGPRRDPTQRPDSPTPRSALSTARNRGGPDKTADTEGYPAPPGRHLDFPWARPSGSGWPDRNPAERARPPELGQRQVRGQRRTRCGGR